MILAALLVSVAMAGEPPPPCTYYEVLFARPGAVRRDSVDQYLTHVCVLDSLGDTLVKVNEYRGITPEAYGEGRRIDSLTRKVESLNEMAKQIQQKNKP